MKPSFCGYYPPTSGEYERLWKDATIVLDTNVLLNLYRLPTSARDEFLNVLDLLKDRLWIPHQVALEFQRNRLTVIAAERKSTEDALNSAQEIVGELRKKVDALQIDKRDLGIETQPILEDLQRANEKLVSAIEETHKAQLDIASSDPVRDRLDALFRDNAGPGPKSQADLDSLFADGENRFLDKVPPGFADTDKGKNPNEATFIHNHLKYQRKFGDLLLWKQLLKHAKEISLKCVLLITADRKEDWWWREQGKTIGALPELVSEIHRCSAVELFWMYSSVQFLEHATKYIGADVSNQAVKELQQVVVSPRATLDLRDPVSRYNIESGEFRSRGIREGVNEFQRIDYVQIELTVAAWLDSKYADVRMNRRGFPDLVAYDGQDAHGFEIKYVRDFDRILLSPSVVNGILRGYVETKEGRLSLFTMVIVISESAFFEITNSDRVPELSRRLGRLLAKYPIDSIVVGAILGGTFEVLTLQREPDMQHRVGADEP
jgi:hypothetical protein